MNVPTVIVLCIVAAVFAAVVINEIIKKKKGKSSCSCSCGGCVLKDSCRSGAKIK